MAKAKGTKTYYEYVSEIIERIDDLYDAVGSLRDAADTNEKQIYNDTRGALGPIRSGWQRFRNMLPEERSQMKF